MKKILLLALVFLGSHVYAANPYSFKRIIFFGDSLTDNGNLYSELALPAAPFFNQRFSNGPVWSDTLSDYYDKAGIDTSGSNYAVGGETIYHHWLGNGYEANRARFPRTFMNSVDLYKICTFYLTTATSWYNDTLYFIWLGGNDYVYGVYDGAENVEKATNLGIESLEYSIRTLIGLGGKQFVLFTQPDLSKTPWSIQEKTEKSTRALSLEHNRKMALMVERLKKDQPNLHIEIFETNKAFDALVEQNKNDPEFTATEPCYTGSFVGYRYGNTTQPCAKPEKHVFWDTVHPTQITHNAIAKEVIKLVDEKFRSRSR